MEEFEAPSWIKLHEDWSQQPRKAGLNTYSITKGFWDKKIVFIVKNWHSNYQCLAMNSFHRRNDHCLWPISGQGPASHISLGTLLWCILNAMIERNMDSAKCSPFLKATCNYLNTAEDCWDDGMTAQCNKFDSRMGSLQCRKRFYFATTNSNACLIMNINNRIITFLDENVLIFLQIKRDYNLGPSVKQAIKWLNVLVTHFQETLQGP